jgi:dUTP pyrophosphatase
MTNTIDVNIKRVRPKAIVPSHGSNDAAGYDLYACLDDSVAIRPHQTVLIGTGWAMQFPNGLVALLYARSGLASKQGLRPANCVGVVDADYRGEYMVALHNDSEEMRIVNHGDRIAQMVLTSYFAMNYVETNELDATERGAGGFGSTGK